MTYLLPLSGAGVLLGFLGLLDVYRIEGKFLRRLMLGTTLLGGALTVQLFVVTSFEPDHSSSNVVLPLSGALASLLFFVLAPIEDKVHRRLMIKTCLLCLLLASQMFVMSALKSQAATSTDVVPMCEGAR